MNEIIEDARQTGPSIFFFDFDGTLATSEKTISPKTRQALEAYAKRGNIFVLCSGRGMPDVKDMAKRNELHYQHMYLIAYNGAEIYDCDAGKTIEKMTFPIELVKEIFSFGHEKNIVIQTYDDEAVVGERPCPEITYYLQFNHLEARYAGAETEREKKPENETFSDITSALTAEPCKCLAFDLDGTKNLTGFGRELEEKFPGRLETVLSQPKYLEIVPFGVSKGNALRWLCGHLGIPMEKSYAAGDADNDISMIRAAGTGIAMKNAMTPQVKEAADVVTAEDNDHDGLVPILNRI